MGRLAPSVPLSGRRSPVLLPLLLAAHACVASPGSQGGPQVRSLRMEGNHRFSTREVLDACVTKTGGPYSRATFRSDGERLLQEYRRAGYYGASVVPSQPAFSTDSSFVDLALDIREGTPARVGALSIEGNTRFTVEGILERFETREGEVLDRDLLERDIEELLRRYERSGYPFASVRIADIAAGAGPGAESLKVALAVDEGREVRIEELRASGNTETSAGVILREAGVRPGDLYDQERIDAIPRRLSRLDIFESVPEPELSVDTRGGVLLIRVREGTPNLFDGVMGYLPGTPGGEEGILTGFVHVTMRNLFGTARKLAVRWQREERKTQEMGLRYLEPWLFGLPVDASGSFQQRQQDTTYVRRLVETSLDLRLGDALTVAGLFNHETTIPSSGIAGISLFNSRTITAGGELRYDSRDDPVSPTGGVVYRSSFLAGSKLLRSAPPPGVRESGTVRKTALDAEWYAEPVFRQVVMLGVHGRELAGDYIEASDLYRFGGASTLRGYRENQFVGSRIAWTNTEYRFLLSRRSFFFGFFDSGYYELPADDARGLPALQKWKYGYGTGIRLETALGNIGVSFALGQGDSFSQGKIHIRIINEF